MKWTVRPDYNGKETVERNFSLSKDVIIWHWKRWEITSRIDVYIQINIDRIFSLYYLFLICKTVLVKDRYSGNTGCRYKYVYNLLLSVNHA